MRSKSRAFLAAIGPTSFLLACALGASAGEPDETAASLPLKKVTDVPLEGRATRLDYQSLDEKTHLLFVAHLGDGIVHVYNVETGKVVADIPDVAQVHGVLVVPELGRCYASATGTNEVVSIDEKTLKVTDRIPGGVYPDGMAYDPDTKKLYVSDESGATETVIDTTTQKRVATIELGGEVGNSQYDAASKHIFVNVQSTNELVEIDPKTDKIVSRTKLEGAEANHGLLIDSERRLAFAACEGNAKLLAIDMTTMKVISTFSVGKGVDVLAFDPGLRRLYAASESGIVSVFEVGTKAGPREKTVKKIAEAFLANNAHTVAVDPTTHKVFFPLKNVGGKPVLRVLEVAGDKTPAERAGDATVLSFDGDEVGKTPAGFTTALTGGGGAVAWSVKEDPTAPSGSHVLAQTSADDTDYRFPLCVYDKLTAKDVSVSVRFKPVEGKVDQAAGIVVRYQDKDNYYVTRANALEDNVRLYHVVKGSRKQFAGVNAKVESGKWHALKLVASGTHFQVHMDGKLLFEADDETFKDAGKVGLWTKADSVTHFDDLTIEAKAAARGGDEPGESDDAQEVQQRLDELQASAVQAIGKKNYEKAAKLLESALQLAAKLPAETRDAQAQLAHYNLACALSLDGKKAPAVEHFARSVELGFHDWEHIDQDTDLDNVRDEPGFKQAIEKAKAGKKAPPKKDEPGRNEPF